MTANYLKCRLFGKVAVLGVMVLMMIGVGLQAQTFKWDVTDWDDDAVINTQDGVLGADSLDPVKAPNAYGRALILASLKANGGIELPVADRFSPNKSFIIEFWYSPVSDGGSAGANGIFFEYSDDTSTYKLYCENSKVKVNFNGVILNMPNTLSPLTQNADDPRWYHISFICKGDGIGGADLALLLDGTNVAAQNIPSMPTVTGLINAYFGKDFNGGYLDEFRFWTAAYTDAFADINFAASDVKDKRFDMQLPDSIDLEAYYRFDDGGASIEDFAHLPGFEAMKSTYDTVNPSDPVAVAAMQADFSSRCQYRLAAIDTNVPIGNLYKAVGNPVVFVVSSADESNYHARGHAMWVTGHGSAVPEADSLRSNSLDDDSDGLADDGYAALDSSRVYAVVRQGNSTALLTTVRNPLKEFMVYDYLGQPLWIVSENSDEAPPSASGAWKHSNDIVLTKKGLSERLSNIDNIDDTGIGQFADTLDYDSDGIPDDTAIYRALNSPRDSSS
ncbi:MAG: LamG-like jellyroll fold domain-containing protein, partial [Lentisphaeria bacterium]